MSTPTRRINVIAWACATLAALASPLTHAWDKDTVLQNRNRPFYQPLDPVPAKEEPRPMLDSNPATASFAFFGGYNSEDPPDPYVYVHGRDTNRDLASPTRTVTGDGVPDTWLRLYMRRLGFYMRRGGGYYIKDFILQTKGYPYRRWDTVANSRYPLLQVYFKGQRVNSATGSIAGFNAPPNELIDLFIADDGLIVTRHTPLELIIVTLDGEYRLDVLLRNPNDYLID